MPVNQKDITKEKPNLSAADHQVETAGQKVSADSKLSGHTSQIQNLANVSPQVNQLQSFQNMANESRSQLSESLQFEKESAEDDLIQGKFESKQKSEVTDGNSVIQGKFEPSTSEGKSGATNHTGLPDGLKTGIENLSGYSMNDVKVHYNSNQPAQFKAHAFAQGSNIHLGAGQEKHLPHEAWHVVQQKQGRVKPTMQMKGKFNVNDDKGLEQEADVMGAKAKNLGLPIGTTQFQKFTPSRNGSTEVAQLNPFKWLAKKFKKNNQDDGMQESLISTSSDSSMSAQEDLETGPAQTPEEDQEGILFEFPGGSYQDGVVTIPIWKGHSISFDTAKKEGSLTGEIPSKTIEPSLPGINPSLDLPVAPGVYVSVGLEIGPTISLEFKGGQYTITKGQEQTSVAISDAGIGGSLGLAITVTTTVGVGVANVVGIEGGGFGTLGGSAEIEGNIGGSVIFSSGTPTYTLDLGLNAGTSIKGEIGAMLKAKIGPFSATKKFPLAEKTFAHYNYNRNLKISNEGANGLIPSIEDFSKTEFGDRSKGKYLKTIRNSDGQWVTYQQLEEEDV